MPKRLSISIIAFLSGVLSLASQIAGLRIATQEVGASPLTVSTILASALLGLSIGSFALGAVADQPKQGRNFAAGLLALASALLLLLAWLGRPFAQCLITLQLPLAVESLAFSAVAVLPINICVGGVVPALAKARADDGGSNFGWVYGLETLGASVGALLLALFLLPQYGLNQSLATIGLVTCLLASIAFRSLGKLGEEYSEEENSLGLGASDGVKADGGNTEPPPMALLAAVFLCSFASLGMELVWQRWFAIAFGSDSQSYAVVASTFLVGISLGAVFANQVVRKISLGMQAYGLLVSGVGISLAISLSLLRSGFETQALQSSLSWMVENPLLSRVALAAAVIILPAVLIGAAFALVVQHWQRGQEIGSQEVGQQVTNRLGTETGKIYGVAILGNVLGVLLCGFWLIPSFGLKNTAVGLAISMQSLGALVLLFVWTAINKQPVGNSLRIPLVFSGLVLSILCTYQVHQENFFAGVVDDGDWRIVRQWERASQTVTVIRSRDNNQHKQLLIDGVNVGESLGGVDEKQQMLAHLPFLVREHKQAHVLTIGLGTGILAGELVQNSEVARVTCVELSDSVIEAADFFADANRDVMNSDKLDLVSGDGMRFLKGTQRTYEVIVSDGKTRPGAASNIPFFTREYYENCASKLSEGGVFTQWVSLHCDEREIKTILASFHDTFPFGYLAFSPPDSIYLVGANSPLQFDSERLNAKLEETRGLRNYYWRNADDILAMYWMSDSTIPKAFPNVAINSSDLQALERYSWSSYSHSVTAMTPQMSVLEALVEHDEKSSGVEESALENGLVSERWVAARAASRAWLAAEQLISSQEENWLELAKEKFEEAIRNLPNMNRQAKFVEFYVNLAASAAQKEDSSTEYAALQAIRSLGMATADNELRMGDLLKSKGAIGKAIDHYYKAVKLSENDPVCRLAFGDALLQIGKTRQAITQFASVIQECGELEDSDRLRAHAELLLGVAEVKSGQIDVGRERIENSLEAYPELESLIPAN